MNNPAVGNIILVEASLLERDKQKTFLIAENNRLILKSNIFMKKQSVRFSLKKNKNLKKLLEIQTNIYLLKVYLFYRLSYMI